MGIIETKKSCGVYGGRGKVGRLWSVWLVVLLLAGRQCIDVVNQGMGKRAFGAWIGRREPFVGQVSGLPGEITARWRDSPTVDTGTSLAGP